MDGKQTLSFTSRTRNEWSKLNSRRAKGWHLQQRFSCRMGITSEDGVKINCRAAANCSVQEELFILQRNIITHPDCLWAILYSGQIYTSS